MNDTRLQIIEAEREFQAAVVNALEKFTESTGLIVTSVDYDYKGDMTKEDGGIFVVYNRVRAYFKTGAQ